MEELQKILDAYEEAERQLLSIIARYALDDEELPADSWAVQKLKDIKQLKNEAVQTIQKLKSLDEQAQRAVIDEYLRGAGTRSDSFIQTNDVALNKFVTDYLGELQATRFQMLRQTLDVYRSIVAQASTQGVLGVDTRLIAAKRALAKFAQEGITGFIDNRGRHWEMRSYAEMSTRTALLNALREGRAAGLEEAGQDLIIVRTGPRYCELCEPWKNKILSLSGKSEQYPSLVTAKAAGLFHPNCRCSYTAYTRGLTTTQSSDIENNYEAEEHQRYMERRIRAYKRVLAVEPDNVKAKAKVKEWRDKLKEHIAEEDLVRKSNREGNAQAR